MLDERTRRIQESLAAAERARAEVAQADRERDELLAATRREIQEMMATAQQVAERIQSEARTTAQQEAQRIVETRPPGGGSGACPGDGRAAARGGEPRGLAAERVISRSLDDQAHRQLVERVPRRAAGARPVGLRRRG